MEENLYNLIVKSYLNSRIILLRVT